MGVVCIWVILGLGEAVVAVEEMVLDGSKTRKKEGKLYGSQSFLIENQTLDASFFMIINFIPSTKEFWGWKIVQPSVYCIVLIMSLV